MRLLTLFLILSLFFKEHHFVKFDIYIYGMCFLYDTSRWRVAAKPIDYNLYSASSSDVEFSLRYHFFINKKDSNRILVLSVRDAIYAQHLITDPLIFEYSICDNYRDAIILENSKNNFNFKRKFIFIRNKNMHLVYFYTILVNDLILVITLDTPINKDFDLTDADRLFNEIYTNIEYH